MDFVPSVEMISETKPTPQELIGTEEVGQSKILFCIQQQQNIEQLFWPLLQNSAANRF